MSPMKLARRSFLVGFAGALFAAPAIVRASSLDLVRGPKFGIEPNLMLAPIVDSATFADETSFEYWVVRGGSLVRVTAMEIIRAPRGIYSPWLPDYTGRLRGTDATREGLFIDANGKFQIGKATNDSLARLRAERDELERKLGAKFLSDAHQQRAESQRLTRELTQDQLDRFKYWR